MMKEITFTANPVLAEMSAEEFRTLAQEALPHLRTVQEALKKALGDDGSAIIHLGADGFIDFTPYKSNWRLSQCKNGKPSIRYEYNESLSIDR